MEQLFLAKHHKKCIKPSFVCCLLYSHTKFVRKGNMNPFHSIFRAIEQQMFMGMRYILTVAHSQCGIPNVLKLFIVNCLLSKFYGMDSLLIGYATPFRAAVCLCVTIESIKIFGRNKNRHYPLCRKVNAQTRNNGHDEIYLKTAIKMRLFDNYSVKGIHLQVFESKKLRPFDDVQSLADTKRFEPFERAFFLMHKILKRLCSVHQFTYLFAGFKCSLEWCVQI